MAEVSGGNRSGHSYPGRLRRPRPCVLYFPRSPTGEHAYPRTGCDLTRRVTPGGAGRKQGVARRVKVLDIRKGHRPPHLRRPG